MNITDFFDPNDPEHVKAYETLEKTGSWPEGFVPVEVEFSPVWQIEILNMLAKCWVKHVMNDQSIDGKFDDRRDFDEQ